MSESQKEKLQLSESVKVAEGQAVEQLSDLSETGNYIIKMLWSAMKLGYKC